MVIISQQTICFFHYKHKMFKDLLKWDFLKVKKFIEFLISKRKKLFFVEIKHKDDSFFLKF